MTQEPRRKNKEERKALLQERKIEKHNSKVNKTQKSTTLPKTWYRLDNAAKVFPAVTTDKRTNTFRVSFLLYEEVDPVILQEALEIVIKRFVSLNVKMKKGLFWYYFEAMDKLPVVVEESPYICRSYKRKTNTDFLFEFFYYKNRIALEVFHSLTDGTGAMELLKSVGFMYLKLKGYPVQEEGLILTGDVEIRKEELEDSFLKNYDPKVKMPRQEGAALHFKGTPYENQWMAIITGILDVAQMKEICRKYESTITEYLGAALVLAAYKSKRLMENKNKPFKLFIPVNLRRFFPTQSLRNFSLFVRSSLDFSEEWTFETIIEQVKKDMREQVQKDFLKAQIVANVKIEKNFLMRIVPLVLKEFVLRLGYKTWGESPNSMSFSNLGIVKLPESMQEYIHQVNFTSGAAQNSPINIGVVSYLDKLMITFTNAIVERDFQIAFFRILAHDGLDVVVETNDLEV